MRSVNWSGEPPTIALDEEFELTRWRSGDAAAHRAFAEDETAAHFLGWTVEDARLQPDRHYELVVERFVHEWTTGARFSFAIRRRDTGEAVGAVELRPADGNVSYLVAPGYRGRGLATRAVAALLGWAGAEHARIVCAVENVASQRVAERCGFRLVGRDGDGLVYER